MGSKLESDTAPLAINTIKSDDPAVQTMKDGEVQSKGWILRFSQYWNVFEMHPDTKDPRPWRFILGSLLTVMYIIGAVILFTYYALETKKDGRPTKISDRFVQRRELGTISTDGYMCSCDFPAEIQSAIKPDTRNKTFNRCYNPEETRKELNVMQYASYHNQSVWDMTAQLTNKNIQFREFADGHRLFWESYELKALAIIDDWNTSFGTPLANLSAKMDSMGYVGEVGVSNLAYLRDDRFFTVPPGFIRATVDYNCTSCDGCEKLWNQYSSTQARNDSKEYNLAWVFCDEDPHSSHVVGQVEGCSGFCRFLRTHDRPWGVELSKIAEELLLYVNNTTNGGKPEVYFMPRLLYANISTIRNNENYTLYFLEVDREGTAWVQLLKLFGEIPECGSDDSQVLICTGASICEFAPTYSFQSVNSEELHVQCENYATGIDFQIDRQKCERIVSEPNLRFVTDLKNTRVSNILCEDFQCQRVLATKIKGRRPLGEAALNHLVYRPASSTSSVPRVCTNAYTDVLVVYEDEGEGKEVEKRLLSIHELNCTSGSSTGCWLTGRYKNMTDTSKENWKQHVFSPEEIKSGETMFACYKFDKRSKEWWLWTFFGNVSGIIGSWLLTLSCVYWAVTRPAPRASVFSQGSSPSHPDAPRPPPSVSLKTFEGYNLRSTWQTSFDIESR
ncbi:hypothetical protein Mapa_017471 [Marchantia paleacea]|nr:hypothetical protein Mapa_017471 [Marchantia paleacea]